MDSKQTHPQKQQTYETEEPPVKKRKLDKNEKEKQRLFAIIEQNPEIQYLKKDIEAGNEDLLASLLDEPQILKALIQMRKIWSNFDQIQPQQTDINQSEIQLKKAKSINKSWFECNSDIDIIKQTRQEFNLESKSRKSIGHLVNDIVLNKHKLELTKQICDEIELLSLNDETINIIDIDAEMFGSDINDILIDDTDYVKNNLLNNTKLNINDCIFTAYFEDEDFSNHSNIVDCSNQSMHNNDNVTLNGNKMKCGDILHIECTSRCTEFSHLWYIVDTDNVTLRRIGMERTGQYIQDPHIIIPGFITSYLLDPIKLYSTFIHHHTYDDAGGVIEIELQLSKDCIIFNDNYTHLMNNISDEQARTMIAKYGWIHKHFSDKLRKNKHFIKDMENEEYYTVYIKTDGGANSALIGECNHPKIDKINLSLISNKNANVGYVLRYKNEMKNMKILNEENVNELLFKLDSNIDIENVSNCLKRGIAFGFIKIDKETGLDTIFYEGECLLCSKMLKCRIKDALYQPDYAGTDYECGGEGGAVKCDGSEDCGGLYVTGMCNGSVHYDSGKFHNHCTECENMGKCIYDYRNTHCYGCNDHYFAGFINSYDCQNCKAQKGYDDFEI